MQDGYLSTAQVSELLKVNETTVKRWTNNGCLHCSKTPGGHRKYLMQDLAEFLGKYKYVNDPSVDLAALGRDTWIPAAGNLSMTTRQLLDAIIKGDRAETFRILSLLHTRRLSFANICDLVIQPAMQEVGRMWAEKQIGIETEHLASHTATNALMRLHCTMTKKPLRSTTALCACLEGELHEIGIACVNNYLESEGWNTYYLGANVPVDSLVNAVEHYSPHLVCLSATVPKKRKTFLRDLIALSVAARSAGAKILIGGNVIKQPGMRRRIPSDACATSLGEVSVFVHEAFG
jgi:MerR family transcriptional regulator, light-induced transcriptional regulator